MKLLVFATAVALTLSSSSTASAAIIPATGFTEVTLVDLGPRQHGSDMIEPAALARAVIVGPFTGNFADVMAAFRAATAMREVGSEAELEAAVDSLLGQPELARTLGRRGQEVVRGGKGATDRHAEEVLKFLPPIDASRLR